MWDAWTRLFHWSLVLSFAASWWTAENDHLDWHRWCGYAIVALLVFRVYWGFVGGSSARFAGFVAGPRAIAAYLRGMRAPAIGHNPLGALSVLAMLALLIAQVALGLFAIDVDGFEAGPLAAYVSFDQARLAAHFHHIVFNALLALIALHAGAVAFYALVKRENLVGPMLTGRKAGAPAAALSAPAWKAALGIVIAILAAIAATTAFKF